MAVLGALLAYYLTGYFQQTLDLRKLELEVQKLALEQRKTDLSGIGQMRELIAQLYKDNITPREAEAIALSLAAFGDLAAPPLIHAIETGSPNRRTGAEVGLAAAALAAQDPVCGTLARVIDNRTALFNWQTHESAIRLLGQLGCQNQRLSVEAFGRLLDGGVAAYRPTVHEDGVPEVDDVIVRRLLDEQQHALQRVARRRGAREYRVTARAPRSPRPWPCCREWRQRLWSSARRSPPPRAARSWSTRSGPRRAMPRRSPRSRRGGCKMPFTSRSES